MIGIIGAMEIEVDLLIEEMQTSEILEVVGFELHVGVLRGHDVAVAVGGIGTTNAAAATAALLATVAPESVICVGVAGGLDPAFVGDVVLGTGLIQYGYGSLDADGFTPTTTEPPRAAGRTNPLIFPTDPALLTAAQHAAASITLDPLECAGDGRVPGFHTGVIATEDAYSIDAQRNGRMQATHGCLAFEMEGAAIAQVCHQNDVRFLAIRAISNMATEADHLAGVYTRCKHETGRSAQRVVLGLLDQLRAN